MQSACTIWPIWTANECTTRHQAGYGFAGGGFKEGEEQVLGAIKEKGRKGVQEWKGWKKGVQEQKGWQKGVQEGKGWKEWSKIKCVGRWWYEKQMINTLGLHTSRSMSLNERDLFLQKSLEGKVFITLFFNLFIKWDSQKPYLPPSVQN